MSLIIATTCIPCFVISVVDVLCEAKVYGQKSRSPWTVILLNADKTLHSIASGLHAFLS